MGQVLWYSPMKPGCVGCLILIVGLIFLAALGGGFLFLSGNIFEEPHFEVLDWSRADAPAARYRLQEIVLRDTGQSGRQDPITLSERETNALVARHLAETAGLRFEPFAMRLVQGQFVLQGRTVLRSLLQGPPFAQLATYLPASQLDRSIWITVRGYITVEPGEPGGKPGRARVVLTEFNLGRQPVGSWPFPVVMGSAGSGLLKWPVPGTVRDVEIEDRRVVIRTR
jgi:hypothetical protein